MRSIIRSSLIALSLSVSISAAALAQTPNEVLSLWQSKSEKAADIQSGAHLWQSTGIKSRQCASCHGKDLTQPGKHVRTQKPIKPMALSSNPKRYSNPRKVAKWLKRNCKWTFGRVCTTTEETNLLAWLIQQ